MVYKNFRINLLFRILVLSLTVFLFFYFINTETFLTPILILTLAILQVYSIFRYVDKTNRDLASFLESIRFSEFTRSFQIEGMGSSFNELNKAFNDVISDFQKVRSEKEEHFHYLQSIVQNIDISILAYQPDGTVEMINKAAKRLFQLSNIKNIQKLSAFSPELITTLQNIKPGENKLVKVQDEDDLLQLAINSTELKIKDKTITLATIKNIQNVLEEQETEAWQKLIRVLTHEIMNSITPIASLSATLENILKPYIREEEDVRELDRESVGEIHQALQTINKRSTGLLHFVNTYRNLTRIPKPNFRIVKVSELFDNIRRLLEKELAESKIDVKTRVEPQGIEISMDDQLIEQVLINLLKNSIHALDGRENSLIILQGILQQTRPANNSGHRQRCGDPEGGAR